MIYDPNKHHRRSIRLQGYDYTAQGTYFVTICVQGRACLLGSVIQSEMHLNAYGQIVVECWEAIPEHFEHVSLDAFVVMPNHVHGIILIAQNQLVPTIAPESIRATSARPNGPLRRSLGAIVGLFKSSAATRINRLRATSGAACWQRNYHEHIVRSESDLARIREYILVNPARWRDDQFHSAV